MILSDDFQEPESAEYIFIDANNHVHVLVPLSGGHTISTDNTCKTNFELKIFLGLDETKEDGTAIKQTNPSALTVLKEYKNALEHDIDLLENSMEEVDEDIQRLKEERLEQIEAYIDALEKLLAPKKIITHHISNRTGKAYTEEHEFFDEEDIYKAVYTVSEGKNNCLGIRLSPAEKDLAVKIPKPVFEVKRLDQQRENDVDGLGMRLRNGFAKDLKIKQQSTLDKIVDTTTQKFANTPFDFKTLQDFLQQKIYKDVGEKVDLSISPKSTFTCFLYNFPAGKINLAHLAKDTAAIIKQGNQYQMYGYSNGQWKLTPLDAATINAARLPFPATVGIQNIPFAYSPTSKPLKEMYAHIQHRKAHSPLIDQQYYKDAYGFDDSDSWEEYASFMLRTCLSDDFWDGLTNLFIEPDPEKLSIKVQFFLAQVNLYCYEHQLSFENFGETFDEPTVADKIVTAVKTALATGTSVEEALFAIVEANRRNLDLADSLTEDDKTTILDNFNEQFKTVNVDGHQFDEFFIFRPYQPGNYVNFKGRISYHLSDLMEVLFPNDPDPACQQLRTKRVAFKKYEGQYLPRRNNNFSSQNNIKSLLNHSDDPNELALFLCQKNQSGQFLFEVYPYAASFFQSDDKDGIEKAMGLIIVDKKFQEKIHLFVTGYDDHQTKIEGAYNEELYNADLSETVDLLKHIKPDYEKLRTWKWTRRSNRVLQLQEIQELIDITTALQSKEMTARNRLILIDLVLKKLDKIYQDIQSESPFFRFFMGPTYLQGLVKTVRDDLIETYDIADEDLTTLHQPETKYIRQQKTKLNNIHSALLPAVLSNITETTPEYNKFFRDRNTRFQNNKSALLKNDTSRFHQLNDDWWLPKNKGYLGNLISLSAHFNTPEAFAFFNATPPEQFDNFMIYLLEKYQPNFPLDVVNFIEFGQPDFFNQINTNKLIKFRSHPPYNKFAALFQTVERVFAFLHPNLFIAENFDFFAALNPAFLTENGVKRLNTYLVGEKNLDVELATGLNSWLLTNNYNVQNPLPSIRACRALAKSTNYETDSENSEKTQPEASQLIDTIVDGIYALCTRDIKKDKSLLQNLAKHAPSTTLFMFSSAPTAKFNGYNKRFNDIERSLKDAILQLSQLQTTQKLDASSIETLRDSHSELLDGIEMHENNYKLSSFIDRLNIVLDDLTLLTNSVPTLTRS